MSSSPASAQALSYANEPMTLQWPRGADGTAGPQDQVTGEGARDTDVLPAALRRQIVDYDTSEAPGTVIIDTPHTVLYYVLGGHRAIRYGVGVGREGFTWAGVETVTRKAEWPDWIPPSEMIARQPYLPRFVAGGPGNPLGARAMYLGASKYRIHGTNDPTTIGKFVSSGCIRMTNTDVEDLFGRVSVGAKVIVLPKGGRAAASRPSLAKVSRVETPRLPLESRPVTAANLTGSALY
ncbi:MAG: L,D-transpeptidase [Xanthobacteraceae bacterium]|nr:L,D-transpeptidase [Xanthobacteraceae bacterium]